MTLNRLAGVVNIGAIVPDERTHIDFLLGFLSSHPNTLVINGDKVLGGFLDAETYREFLAYRLARRTTPQALQAALDAVKDEPIVD